MSEMPRNPAAVARKSTEGRFLHTVQMGAHSIVADEPGRFGGLDAGPSPYDLLSAALAACTSMTLHLFAEGRKLVLPPFQVEVRHEKIHAEDCLGCVEGGKAKIDRFQRRIIFDGPIEEGVGALLLRIADKCPVDITLKSTASVLTRLEESPEPVLEPAGVA